MIALRNPNWVCQTGCCEKGREKSKGKHHYIEIHVRKRGKQERNHKSHVLILSKRWGNESSVEFNETYSKLIWTTSFEDQMSGGNFKTEVVSGSNMITNIKVKKSKYRFVLVWVDWKDESFPLISFGLEFLEPQRFIIRTISNIVRHIFILNLWDREFP